jgi:hypothetical protein
MIEQENVASVLRPPDELLGFKYLNEIGIENEHFNSATLSDK